VHQPSAPARCVAVPSQAPEDSLTSAAAFPPPPPAGRGRGEGASRGASRGWGTPIGRRIRTPAALLALALAASGCTWTSRQIFGAPPVGHPGHVSGFYGAVAADEGRAAITGRDVLSGGGNAADAAAAIGFTLAVTLPSRAGLGGGGACLVFRPGKGTEALLFTPTAPARPAPAADRPAAVPMLALGMGELSARYGHFPLVDAITPAQQLAHFGVPVSRALARDIAVVGLPLLADPGAAAVFAPNGAPLTEGAILTQPDLGATLAQLRDAGVADLYRGALARRFQAAADSVGAGLAAADLARASAFLAPPIVVAAGRDQVAFLPPPADGGLAAAAAFRVLMRNPAALRAAEARALAVAARWRAAGGRPEALLSAALPPGTLPLLPASTTFLALDGHGMAVACAASPAAVPTPLLSAAIAARVPGQRFRAAVAGSGQQAAPVAVADGLAEVLLNASKKGPLVPRPVPEPGRVDAISCPGYLPGDEDTCRWMTDPRGTGAAYGGSED
jgi:gamma-glutamyltranspeptidase/glutathione hydrolase